MNSKVRQKYVQKQLPKIIRYPKFSYGAVWTGAGAGGYLGGVHDHLEPGLEGVTDARAYGLA